MRISEVASCAGVGVETVRFYERKGLIQQPVKPAEGGFRSYPEQVAVQIRFIRQAQELGFSLSEIEDLLSLKSERPDWDVVGAPSLAAVAFGFRVFPVARNASHYDVADRRGDPVLITLPVPDKGAVFVPEELQTDRIGINSRRVAPGENERAAVVGDALVAP